MFFVDSSEIQKISHHPVHIVDKNGSLTPSSFIPFCEYGTEKNIVGEKTDSFDDPVCNKFQEIKHFGGICYEIDVNGFKDSIPFNKAKDAGLTFWMDYNFEKQTVDKEKGACIKNMTNFAEKYFLVDNCNKASIYIGTICKQN